MTTDEDLMKALFGGKSMQQALEEAKRAKRKATLEKAVAGVLTALVAWPLKALFLWVSLDWVNSYWNFVPTLPFWGAMAVVFAIGSVRSAWERVSDNG